MNMGSKYHVRYTMDRWFDIPWVGGQYTMDRGVNIPWIGGSMYIFVPWVGVKIPRVGESIFHV